MKKDFKIVEDHNTIRVIVFSNGGNVARQQKLISQLSKSKKEIICEVDNIPSLGKLGMHFDKKVKV